MPLEKMKPDWEEGTESPMPVNLVAKGKQNVAESGRFVGIARISILHVPTQMANETGPKSETIHHSAESPILTRNRQFGTMTDKLTDYEKLLKDLMGRVGDADAKLIRASLEKVGRGTILV